MMPVEKPPRIVIFARWPEPGKVKTRLAAKLGDAVAAKVYRRLLDHTLEVSRESGLPIELRVTGAAPTRFADAFGTEIDAIDQGPGDLGERLTRVTAPALIVGSDLPGLSSGLLHIAAEALSNHDVVIGPARDGGYWLIGFRKEMPWLFADMAWSTPAVLPTTLARLESRGVVPVMLPELADIDEPADLSEWPDFTP